MNNLILKNTDDQIVLEVLTVAEEINEDWWNKHGDDFLKGLNQ